MKKLMFLSAVVAALALSSCDPQPDLTNPAEMPELAGSFPRKHLIEHFTGEQCGYCPGGMNALSEAIQGKEDNFIWVSNHYGYGKDEYTIPGNSVVGKKLGVTGAPSMSLDRTAYTVGGSKSTAFHPGYLEDLLAATKLQNTSFVSVSIDRLYEEATRKLTVTINGKCEKSEVKSLLVTFLVKESGTVGAQHDYEYAWTNNGWSEFRHTKTVRAYVSAPLGDTVAVKNGSYTATYSIELDKNWNADNCSAVAFATWPEGCCPVLNAEQVPVVSGTKGGEDIKHGGITMIDLTDRASESSAQPVTNMKFAAIATDYDPATKGLLVQLVADTTFRYKYGNNYYSATPLLQLEFFTGSENLVDGTYPLSDSKEIGTTLTGHHMVNVVEYTGAQLMYAYTDYLQQNMLFTFATFLGATGEVVVDNGTISVDLTTYHEKNFTGVFAPAATKAPAFHGNALRKANVRFDEMNYASEYAE